MLEQPLGITMVGMARGKRIVHSLALFMAILYTGSLVSVTGESQ